MVTVPGDGGIVDGLVKEAEPVFTLPLLDFACLELNPTAEVITIVKTDGVEHAQDEDSHDNNGSSAFNEMFQA